MSATPARTTAPPHLLLLAASLPGGQEVGGLLLRDLLASYPVERVTLFATVWPHWARTAVQPADLVHEIATVPFREGAAWEAGRLGRLWTAAQYAWMEYTYLPRLMRRALRLARTRRVDAVWAVLEHPVLYALATTLARVLNVPLLAMVWDPEDSIALNLRLDAVSKRRTARQFDAALRQAERLAVVSEAMRDEYETRYRRRGVILRAALDTALHQPTGTRPHDEKTLTIGFCGSLYARAEWQALLAALQAADWRIGGRDVQIRMLSSAIHEHSTGATRIEWLGWRSPADTVRALGECDVCYLPYWFDPLRANATRLCFPTKLTTYLAAGRPIFYHGPATASPPRFFEAHPVGVCCHSLARQDIQATLTQVVQDTSAYARKAAAIDAVRTTEFSRDTLQQRFAEFVGWQPTCAASRKIERSERAGDLVLSGT